MNSEQVRHSRASSLTTEVLAFWVEVSKAGVLSKSNNILECNLLVSAHMYAEGGVKVNAMIKSEEKGV